MERKPIADAGGADTRGVYLEPTLRACGTSELAEIIEHMGLRAWIKAVRSEPDIVWVPGEFHVTAASTPAFAATMSSGWWTGELKADGIAPVAITHHGIAPVDRWPQPGQMIRVSVVPSDTTLIKFDWASIAPAEDVGMEAARRLVETDTTGADASEPDQGGAAT
jgi:hypothetical protein